MKKTVFFVLTFVLGACSTTRDYKELTKQVGNNGLQVYEDKKNGNVCYVYRDSDASSVSCIKK